MATIAELYNLAAQYHQYGNVAEAESLYRQIIQADPRHADALNNLGVLLLNQGRLDDAVECFRQSVASNPGQADAHSNLGVALKDQGKVADAIRCFHQALAPSNPSHTNAADEFGNRPIKRWDSLRRAASSASGTQRPYDFQTIPTPTCNSLGLVYLERGDWAEAAASFQQALRLNPQPRFGPPNSWQLSLKLRGDYLAGWPGFVQRWAQFGEVSKSFKQPRWDGAPLDGKTILLHGEQGLGDTVQFIRYAPLVKACGGRVLVQCQPALIRLFAGMPGIDALIPEGAPLPAFDVQVHLLDLGAVFQTTPATIPGPVPYLFAEAK